MRPQEQAQIFTVALAGQPNTGKSTVFNLLTGMNQHVGNWPGKTVEKKEGEFSCNGNTYRMIDLPGTYSLSANSEEEIIARDYIIREQPELVVVVVNAAALERTLYLVSEILTLKIPMLVVLNMMDVAEAEGRMAIWWISYFPTGEINTSYLGHIGRWFTPLGDLMGLDWKMITALFASMLNKEATMATMGVILATESPADLLQVLRAIMTPAAAIAFLAAQMLFMPCFWTMGVMYTESRSLKMVFGMMLYMVLISLTMGIATYQILRLFL